MVIASILIIIIICQDKTQWLENIHHSFQIQAYKAFTNDNMTANKDYLQYVRYI